MPVRLWIAAVSLLAMVPATVRAADDRPPYFPDAQIQEHWKRAEELARKSMDELLRSFEQLKQAMPEYGAPYFDENGDIVIPRKRWTAPPLGTPVPEPRPERA